MRRILAAGLVVLSACATVGIPISSPSPSPSPSPTPDLSEYFACEGGLGDLLGELQELDARLDVGMQFEHYNTAVGDAKVEYDRIEFASLDAACLKEVGVPLEEALNGYIKAGGQWNECISDFDCSTEDIEPELRAKWSKATRKIGVAAEALEDLRG